MTKRVGIIGLLHESNTFMPTPATLADFQRLALLRGPALVPHFQNAHHEIGGFLQGCRDHGLTPVPIFAARATPSGVITQDTFDTLLSMMLEDLDSAGPLDALLVAPHGAAVAQHHPDADGHWLTLLRNRFPSSSPTSPFPTSPPPLSPAPHPPTSPSPHPVPFPILSTLDPHANLTPRMVAATTAITAYRTNPHLDQRERGLEAASLLARTLSGQIRPTQAAAFPPVAINIEAQLTSDSPCRELYALADDIRRRPGVLSASVLLGFPYADVPGMGSSFVVATDNDPALAQTYADELAAYLWTHRADFAGHLIPPDEAIDLAMSSPRPACLLDMGDNVGGGSPADSTTLAHALHHRRINAFISLYDPAAASLCHTHPPGTRLTLSMGGHTALSPSPTSPFPTSPHSLSSAPHPPTPPSPHLSPFAPSPPLTTQVTLLSLHPGRFTEPQPRHGGNTSFDMGPTAIVRTDSNLTVQLTSRRTMPASLHQLLSCGIDPRTFDILVAKGVHAPHAAYAPVCPTLIRVNTPGITSADLTSLPYHHRRQPLYPFDP